MRKIVFAPLLLVTLGCGAGESEVASIIKSNNDSNGKRLANLYYMHQIMSPQLIGPRHEEDFKNFIRSMRPEQLAEMNVDADLLQELFVSERDGQPFAVRYGVAMPGSGGGHHQAVVFERQGRGGNLAVFMTGPKVIHVPVKEASAYRAGLYDQLSIPPEQPGE